MNTIEDNSMKAIILHLFEYYKEDVLKPIINETNMLKIIPFASRLSEEWDDRRLCELIGIYQGTWDDSKPRQRRY